jgi:hypothetical protein
MVVVETNFGGAFCGVASLDPVGRVGLTRQLRRELALDFVDRLGRCISVTRPGCGARHFG